MNDKIIKLEARTGLPSKMAHKLLGLTYPGYMPLRRGSRQLPHYIDRCIDAIMLLDDDVLQGFIKKHVYDN